MLYRLPTLRTFSGSSDQPSSWAPGLGFLSLPMFPYFLNNLGVWVLPLIWKWLLFVKLSKVYLNNQEMSSKETNLNITQLEGTKGKVQCFHFFPNFFVIALVAPTSPPSLQKMSF